MGVDKVLSYLINNNSDDEGDGDDEDDDHFEGFFHYQLTSPSSYLLYLASHVTH